MGRLSEYINKTGEQGTRKTGAGSKSISSTTVVGLNEINKKLQALAMWSQRDHDNLVRINTQVAEIYANMLKSTIVDFKTDIEVYRRTGGGPGRKKGQKGEKRQTIKKGTLRRSVKVWQPDKDRIQVWAGPRTRRDTSKKVNRVDGWFAAIVEGGDYFGNKSVADNTGVHEWSMKATRNRMQKLRNALLKVRYEKYLR
jgi:hypothetical protein